MKITIGDDPSTLKETVLIRECYLTYYSISIGELDMICLAFEQLDVRYVLPMTVDMTKEDDIRDLVITLARLRDNNETEESDH
jgi:hypothetical protein